MLTDDDNITSSPMETPIDNLAHSIVSARAECQLNLILHNVEESLKQDASDRKSDDLSRVNSLFTDLFGSNMLNH